MIIIVMMIKWLCNYFTNAFPSCTYRAVCVNKFVFLCALFCMWSCVDIDKTCSHWLSNKMFEFEFEFVLSYHSDIYQARQQQWCLDAYQISKWYDNSEYQSRDFESLRRFIGYWNGPWMFSLTLANWVSRSEMRAWAVKQLSFRLYICIYKYPKYIKCTIIHYVHAHTHTRTRWDQYQLCFNKVRVGWQAEIRCSDVLRQVVIRQRLWYGDWQFKFEYTDIDE